MNLRLRITELFYSLQGESVYVGLPTVFIRLTGCPLRCQYCDTAYAFRGGQFITIDNIMKEVSTYACKYVCVTGGEPLAQPACIHLLSDLCNRGYLVSIETSGARDISKIDKRVIVVMDIKTPDSNEAPNNLWSNLDFLKPMDQIKFVLCSRSDYDWACRMVEEHRLAQRAQILFSPSWNQLSARSLADWIVHDKLPVRFQLQLHKILWDDAPGH